MPTLMKMELDSPNLIIKLSEKIVNLKKEDGDYTDVGLFVLSDGFAYYYQGIYAFSDSNNKVKELIIADLDKIGLIVIDTKEVSKTQRVLIRKIEEFLSSLYKRIGDVTQDNMSNVIPIQDRTIAELKEEIIIQHAV